MKKIGIVMGSDSDLPVVEKAMATLGNSVYPLKRMFTLPTEHLWKQVNLQKVQEKTALVPLSQQPAKRHIWQVLWQQTQHFL